MRVRFWLLLAMLPFLAACPAQPLDADEKRLSVMRAEPLVAKMKNPAAVKAFKISKKDAPRRSYVIGQLSEEDRPDAFTSAQKSTAATAAELTANQWTVYFAVCVPPKDPASAAPKPESNPIVPHAMEGNWLFASYAYKVIDGVSYFAEVKGTGYGHGRTAIHLRLRAPYTAEGPDLFKDRPAAIDLTSSCLGAASLPAKLSQTGTAVIMDDDGPDPDVTSKPEGHR